MDLRDKVQKVLANDPGCIKLTLREAGIPVYLYLVPSETPLEVVPTGVKVGRPTVEPRIYLWDSVVDVEDWTDEWVKEIGLDAKTLAWLFAHAQFRNTQQDIVSAAKDADLLGEVREHLKQLDPNQAVLSCWSTGVYK